MKPVKQTQAGLLVSKPAFSDLLHEEVIASGHTSAEIITPSLVQFSDPLPEQDTVFEQFRIEQAVWTDKANLRGITQETVDQVFGPEGPDGPFSMKVISNGEDDPKLSRRCLGILREMLKVARKAGYRWPGLFREKNQKRGCVLHFGLLEEGLTSGWTPLEKAGSFRMKDDPDAPSRSYLKVEEAFYRMGLEPKPGDRIMDLGAAPGGWTYACLKRGAHVIAVDRGPLKIPDIGSLPGTCSQSLGDGLTATPDNPPIDWLLGDMLVPPGAALGVLKNWMGKQWAHRIVLNVKLPQTKPWPVLIPLLDYLKSQTDYQTTVKQLYHDRREITVMAVKK